MEYINRRSDFILQETFSLSEGIGEVPSKFTLEYGTPDSSDSFTASRDGDEFEGCQLSSDGKALIVCLPLSQMEMGEGRLRRTFTRFVEDTRFPSGYQARRTVSWVGVYLWDGASEGSDIVVATIVK